MPLYLDTSDYAWLHLTNSHRQDDTVLWAPKMPMRANMAEARTSPLENRCFGRRPREAVLSARCALKHS